MPRTKPSWPFTIAQTFVRDILKRDWRPQDNKIAMAHAKSLLKDYRPEDILGCLQAIVDGIIEPPLPLQTLAALRKFEPALMDRWFDYLKNPPPIYMETVYRKWLETVEKTRDAKLTREEAERQRTMPLF